jgi:hypothetical protein
MAAEITQIDIQDFTSQTYGGSDTSLLSQFEIDTSLTSNSYIEYFVYDNDKNLLSTDYSFSEYTVLNDGQSAGNDNNLSQIEINPEQSLINSGYDQGEYITYFNILNKQIGSELQQLYIAEISSDRTEIRLDSTSLTNIDIVEQTNNFIQERDNNSYFLDFYINFGDNQLYIANNISLDNQYPTNPTVLIKLYEPLSDEFDINSTLWVVTILEEPIAYKVTFEDTPIIFTDTTSISGPNFNLELKDQINNSSLELSYADLVLTSLTSSTNQLNSLLEEKEIDINVDYTNFNNFIHFSSAKARTENFYHKISLIEQYSSSIALIDSQITGSTSSSISVSSSKAIYASKIDNIITNFDGYDYYLYYYSGSSAWPKTNSTPPYQLESTNSNAVLTWLGSDDETNAYYGGILLSASLYDNLNPNNLFYTIPEYLREDPANDPYQLFIEMVGQHYDNIWIYYKDVTQKYNADNRLENGISKDIVADAIRDFGIKLYQNNFSNEDLYTAFLGLTPEGGLFPFPNITGSLPTPSGYEYIDTKISASNDYLPLDDVNKSLYKRIYHNLPYLLQTKGTLPGLRALITSYGIPDTVLRINEYGGKDKANTNDWDYWQNEFNYAYYTTGSNFIFTPWELNLDWNSVNNVPNTLEFRFRTNGLPTGSIPYSQSLWYNNLSSTIVLEYTGSGYNTGSYSGSIIDPYYQYANLILYPDITNYPNTSASVYLPFFDGGWWSVMVNRTPNGGIGTFGLYSGNKIYEGGDNGTLLGFYSSSSVIEDDTAWSNSVASYFARGNAYPPKLYQSFSGSLQEIRYYSTNLTEPVFKDYIMNPHSTEGINLNSSPNELMFRASLGGELYTGSLSIHPKVTGSWAATSSFGLPNINSFNFYTTPTFVPNTEYFFYDQPAVGIKNAVSDKIRLENNVMPSGDTLSPFRSLAQQLAISQSYTANTNLLEVAFSPQDEINEDIMDQIGYFDIGEYIGDPRLRSSSAESYPLLDTLRNEYFQKYTKNYDLVDYIRLIKFFDNSLFKMIKDFVPARASLASGIVIKQHLLERNKYPQPQVNNNSTIAYYPSGSSTNPSNNQPLTFQNIIVTGTVAPQWNDFQPGTIEDFNGGAGGVFNSFNYVGNTSQSWYETIPTISGSVIILHNTQDEFYDGEFSGSNIIVTTQSLAQSYPLDNFVFDYTPVRYSPLLYDLSIDDLAEFTQNQFLNSLTIPDQGEILLLRPYFRFGGFSPSGNPLPNITGPTYVKIHKFDNNGVDNTIPLGQANKLLIQYSTIPSYYTLNILTVNEYSTYYLYEVNTLGSNTADNYILDYSVSASNITPILPPSIFLLNSFNTISGNTLGFFDNVTGLYSTPQTSNVALIVSASITTSGSSIGGGAQFFISSSNNGILAQKFITVGDNITTTLTASYYSLGTDKLSFTYSTLGGNLTLKSGSFLITQSIAPSAAENDPIIIEPYITEPNFYNSDYNALLNNVDEYRLSTVYQDVDYSTGTTTPTNFSLLISGSAIKAPIQDSNYTTKRHIIPRYEGSKSTSQYLNVWTEGDSGTYGKTPTVESLKTMVAYCDSISGWPPERMNASAVHVLYLIKQDGTVVIPNASQNSLADIQGTFMSGEKLFISSKTIGSGEAVQSRNIIRGGTRIEPILYTQIGKQPGAQWSTGSGCISFTNIIPADISIVPNVSGKYGKSTTQINSTLTQDIISFPNTILGTPLSTYSTINNSAYTVTSNVIDNGINLSIGVKLLFIFNSPSSTFDGLAVNIYKKSTSGSPVLLYKKWINSNYSTGDVMQSNTTYTLYTPALGQENTNPILLPSNLVGEQQGFFTIPSTNLNTGDLIFITLEVGMGTGESYSILSNSSLIINQYPISLPSIDITGNGVPSNQLWGYPDPINYPNIITSSNAGLIEAYGNPKIKQVDISSSGFNPISLPFIVNIGDEFRFEGREDYTFEIKNIYAPQDEDNRLFPTGSIEIHFPTNLPTSSTTFNLDHFVIRKYVDDASLILMEGFKPTNSNGPYIVRPEYIVPELNKDVDQFILDLTQKGLIT